MVMNIISYYVELNKELINKNIDNNNTFLFAPFLTITLV